MIDELKPVRCGCGGEATIKHYWQYRYYDDTPYFYVWCQKCHIKTDGYDTEAEAITAWNRAMGERMVKVKNIEDPAGLGAYGDCANCGGEVNENYAYCPNCGRKLEWE